MSNIYLLVGLPDVDESETTHFLNARSEVEDWISLASFGYLLKSSHTAGELTNAIASYLKTNGHKNSSLFLITRVHGPSGEDIQGYLPKALWEFLGQRNQDASSIAATVELPEYEFPGGDDEEVPF